jgi:MFS family permease
VDPGGDVLRPVHGHARQHGRERRAAVDPADFDASISALEWTVNAYTLVFAVLLVTGGRLGDIFGRVRMFLFGVVVFALVEASSASPRTTPGSWPAAPSRASAPRS